MVGFSLVRLEDGGFFNGKVRRWGGGGGGVH